MSGGLVQKLWTYVPKSFADLKWLFLVNPTFPATIVSAKEYRAVAPGSQKTYVPWKNTAVHQNYYFNRDVRRSYPKTVVFDQADITTTLLASQPQTTLPAYSDPVVSVVASTVPQPLKEQYVPPTWGKKYRWIGTAENVGPDVMNPRYSVRFRK